MLTHEALLKNRKFVMVSVPPYCHCFPQNLNIVPLKKCPCPLFPQTHCRASPIPDCYYRSSLILVCAVDQKASRSFQLGTKADDLCHDWGVNSLYMHKSRWRTALGFLRNTSMDPWKITKLPSQHSVGHHWPACKTENTR